MYRLIERREIAPSFHEVTIEAPDVAAKARPGNFVILRVEDDGERIPFTIADWDASKGTVTSVFEVSGATTNLLSMKSPGEEIPTYVGPLGNATEIGEFGTVVTAGGCYGIGAVFPIARALAKAGNRVISLIEARSSNLHYWLDRYENVADELRLATSDGSTGKKGHNWDLLADLLDEGTRIDRIVAIGCTFMMHKISEASRPLGIPTRVALNPIMIDGTGMCGVCRCLVAGKVRFACVDGPEFDGHDVDWGNIAARRASYIDPEARALANLECRAFAAARPLRRR